MGVAPEATLTRPGVLIELGIEELADESAEYRAALRRSAIIDLGVESSSDEGPESPPPSPPPSPPEWSPPSLANEDYSYLTARAAAGDFSAILPGADVGGTFSSFSRIMSASTWAASMPAHWVRNWRRAEESILPDADVGGDDDSNMPGLISNSENDSESEPESAPRPRLRPSRCAAWPPTHVPRLTSRSTRLSTAPRDTWSAVRAFAGGEEWPH